MKTELTIVIAADRDRTGYVPLHITLTGFKGIRSGLGRDSLVLDLEALCTGATLVALSGTNGRGKSTIIDNLHPYLVMPSRASADGLGAFSYYDHLYLPESEKILVWRHAGARYRSHLVFRLNGRRKTEAFLFIEDAGSWRPVQLADGTVVDGKVDTYEQAVAAILGPADTFFTSVFSAQGKRPLSAFKNSEIKSLLGDLLGLEKIRQQGARAAETTRLLKAGLTVVRTEQGQAADTVVRLNRQVEASGDPSVVVAEAEANKAAAAAELVDAQTRIAQLEADAVSAEGTERRRADLHAEREKATGQVQATAKRTQEEGARLDQRQALLRQRADARKRQHRERVRQLEVRRAGLVRTRELAGAIDRAVRRQDLAVRVVEQRRARLVQAQALVDNAERLKEQVRRCNQDVAGIEREAGQLALRQSDLQRRYGLALSVPCAGTDLQGRCQLLGDAREAQALLPSVDGQLGQLADGKRDALALKAEAESALDRLSGAAEQRNLAELRLERAEATLTKLRLTAAREGELEQARSSLAAVDEEVCGMGAEPAQETEGEGAERREIEEARLRLQGEATASQADANTRLQAANRALAELPASFDTRALATARSTAASAAGAVQSAERRHQDAIRRQEQLAALLLQLETAQREQAQCDDRAARIEQALSQWSLLAKCLSNDGVIALDIDDAGPTFAALANDLLLACYGPRFTLEVCTQTATAKGELREDFDIIVHDGLRGESKSLKLVSGGERVWINECLTRAIALYLAGNTGRRFGALFSDEADGPLDPEHKRMFMEMKREVLRLGGYEREFYVSQTPELTAMADVVIDLDAMARQEVEVVA
jgi:exonuclease SbcC